MKGVAFGKYGTNPMKIDVTLLDGKVKRGIGIEETHQIEINTGPDAKKSIDYFLSFLERANTYHRERSLPRVPCVYGADTYDGVFERMIFEQYPQIASLEGHVRTQIPPEQTNQYLFVTGLKTLTGDRNEESFEFVFSGYSSAKKRTGLSSEDQTQSLRDQLGEAFLGQINREFGRYFQTQEVGDLGSLIEHIAEGVANCLKIIGSDSRKRFISFSTSGEIEGGDPRVIIFSDPILREIYEKKFLEVLNPGHNVCMKSSNDPSAPAFSDIVCTYMADLMDEKTGNSPSFVSVNLTL